MSSTKRKIEHFHAIVAQQRQKIYMLKNVLQLFAVLVAVAVAVVVAQTP